MVNSNKIPQYLFIAIAFLLNSCSHYYYAPNEGALLALNEKNDLKVSAGKSNSSDDREFNYSLQVGYSPIKHLGIQSSYFNYRESGVRNSFTESGNGHISTAAIGTYYFFPTKKIGRRPDLVNNYTMNRGILIDLYAGRSNGSVNNYYTLNSSSHFDFNKTYGQFGFHWQGRVFGINYVSKFGVLDFKNGTVNGKISQEHLADIMDVEKNDTYNFRENSIRFHIGVKHARFFITGTWFNSPKSAEVKFVESTLHGGVIIEIDEFFKKKTAESEPITIDP